MPGLYYFDPLYIILVFPAIILTMYAQSKVNSTFNKYLKVRSIRGYTGAETAKALLQYAGIYDVKIEMIPGQLTDHYDPRSKTLRLSSAVYNGQSIASLGVAAHEVGHAIQHHRGYVFLVLRNSIVPIVNIGSRMAMPLIMLGLLFSYTLIEVGILLFAGVVLFQIITLPVELNASGRAIKILEAQGFLADNEIGSAKKVLNAAALTYVASAAVAVANLLHLLLRFGGRDD
ncbi:zinc metallopeptidase [Defluviitalea phaphyphila]|uniref:zinc metallopeptidase n=1 Tax=Defluviitalea phaphyphila TaxID=1473580 RepID=UPI0007310E46|nr:zinc metallopeptidase [Defluviitalea phaphyphila]